MTVLSSSFPVGILLSGSVDNLLNSDHRPVFASFMVGVSSEFVQNRASLQDAATVNIIFKTIEAQACCSVCVFPSEQCVCLLVYDAVPVMGYHGLSNNSSPW